MTSKKNSKSTAKKSEEKKAEKLLKSANAANTQLKQASATLSSTGVTAQSLANTQQTIDNYISNITILADKVMDMWKNHKVGTNEYKELTVTLNNYISLARTFRNLVDEQRKLLMISY